MISVIIPLYNKEKIIEYTLNSVLSQDYDDFEVIVVNDGSTDGSVDIVKRVTDSRLRLVEQQNGGPSKARNTGVEHSKGEWIVFLDADDELTEGALKSYSALIEQHNDVDIVDCGQYISNGDVVTALVRGYEGYCQNPFRDWFFRKIGPGSNHSIFRKSLLKKYPYNNQIKRFEDAELLTRILQDAKVYSSKIITAKVNGNFSCASNARKHIMEDYMGYLDMSKGGFWYKMCVFRTFIEEREHYSDECRKRYANLYHRYDLLLMVKLLSKLHFCFE